MGAYTILTADGGRLDFDRTHITELGTCPEAGAARARRLRRTVRGVRGHGVLAEPEHGPSRAHRREADRGALRTRHGRPDRRGDLRRPAGARGHARGDGSDRRSHARSDPGGLDGRRLPGQRGVRAVRKRGRAQAGPRRGGPERAPPLPGGDGSGRVVPRAGRCRRRRPPDRPLHGSRGPGGPRGRGGRGNRRGPDRATSSAPSRPTPTARRSTSTSGVR